MDAHGLAVQYQEMPSPATTLCLSRQERELLDEVRVCYLTLGTLTYVYPMAALHFVSLPKNRARKVEIHSSAGLRHLAHASSHLHDARTHPRPCTLPGTLPDTSEPTRASGMGACITCIGLYVLETW